ncbi:MAG: site-specific integrase [Pseudomonadota bacterium]
MSEYRIVRYKNKFYVSWSEQGKTRRVSLRTDDRREAGRRFEKFKKEINRPEATSLPEIWQECEAEYRATGRVTADRLYYAWKALAPTFEHVDPEDISQEDCLRHQTRRRADGVMDSTIHAELRHLRLVVRWADTHGYIERAPHIFLPETPEPRDRYLTRSEALRLIDCCATPHVRLFTQIALQTAARKTAILELTWDRVDFARNQIDFVLFTGRRRKGRAVVPMPKSLRQTLLDVRRDAPEATWVVEYGGNRVIDVKKAFQRAVERAKLEGHVTPHTLRHTAAVWMAEDGALMSKIAAVLGHKDSQITQRVYARYSPSSLGDVVSALEL